MFSKFVPYLGKNYPPNTEFFRNDMSFHVENIQQNPQKYWHFENAKKMIHRKILKKYGDVYNIYGDSCRDQFRMLKNI